MTPDEVQRIATTARRLEAAARAAGAIISADGRVSEAVAAQLLAIDVRTLRRMRYRRELPSFHVAMNGSRVSYRLEHLAALVELSAEFDESRHEVDTRTDVAPAAAASSEPSARGGVARPASGNRPNAEPPPPALEEN